LTNQHESIDDSSLDLSIGSQITSEGGSKTFLPKTLLQLRGISIAIYNMTCNFSIMAAICLMVQYDLSILAIQEHTQWSRELSAMEITNIKKTCDKWGFLATIAKLRILIIDKQLAACHRNTNIFEEGRLIQSHFEVSHGNFVTFISIYGIPHSSDNHSRHNQRLVHPDENSTLQKMASLQRQPRLNIVCSCQDNDIIHVYEGLQYTPDNSKTFHYGTC